MQAADQAALSARGRGWAAAAAAQRHRAVVVLAGGLEWGRAAALALTAEVGAPGSPGVWLGPGPIGVAAEGALAVAEGAVAVAEGAVAEGAAAVPRFQTRSPGRARDLLGHEYDRVVLDLHVGFDPEALGAVGGTVRAGGLLVLLTPPLAEWHRWPDPGRARVTVEGHDADAVGTRLVARLARMLPAAAGVWVVPEGGPLPPWEAPPTEGLSDTPPVVGAEGSGAEGAGAEAVGAPGPCTADQAVAVAAIVRVAQGRKRRPAVLTSDRGRGKSAALGLAAGQLLSSQRMRIAVTAPNQGAVLPVLQMAARVLEHTTGQRYAARWPLHGPAHGQLMYVSPGELLAHPDAWDLVLVDEAATLPVPVLARLLEKFPRVAFSTTVHGYEGTGRGFTLRFREILDARAPGWRAVTLQAPVRFAAGDPLEAFTFAALCLDATAAPDGAVAGAVVAGCTVARLDRDALAADEAGLRALFGLLVTAHYRTTPGDLYRLLDGPNLSVDVLRWEGHIVAAALVAAEGGLSPALCAGIFEGRRRPQGHMIPETLCMHAGVEWAPSLVGARVVRIAVHPAVRSRGLGARLLQHIIERAVADGLDWVGSGFGATRRLLGFWARAGFVPVRMGVTPGKSSGAWTAVVLRPISPAGLSLFETVQAQMRDELPHALTDSLRSASVNLAGALVAAVGTELHPSAADRAAAAAVAWGPRISDVATAAVWRCVWAGLTGPAAAALDPVDRAVLLRRVVQRWPWEALVADLGLAGRVPAQNRLRSGLATLLAPACTAAERAAFVRFADAARTVQPPGAPEEPGLTEP